MKCLKVALFTVNLLIWIAGGLVLAIGAWLLMEPSKGHLLNLFTADTAPHETIYFVAYILLGFGFVVLTVGFFGCKTVIREGKCAVTLYMGMLTALIIAEAATVSVLGIMTYRVLSNLETRLLERISKHYGHDAISDADFSQSLDFAQYKFNCCGIYSDRDFNNTAWWRDSQISGTRRQVPLTCCVLKDTEIKNTGSPMSVISRVFYKNNEKPWLSPQPKDESSCESSDLATQQGFRHQEGCIGKIRSFMQYDSLTLIVIGVGIAFAQLVSVVMSVFVCREIRERPPR